MKTFLLTMALQLSAGFGQPVHLPLPALLPPAYTSEWAPVIVMDFTGVPLRTEPEKTQ